MGGGDGRNWSVFNNRENDFSFRFLFMLSLFRLLECFCISMASLYFLGNYVMLAIVVVLSTIFDVLFRCCILIMLIAWRFNLTSRCSFIRRLTIVPVFLMYLSAGTRYFVYSCGAEWRSLIFRIS